MSENNENSKPATAGSECSAGLGGPSEMTGWDFAQLMSFYGVSSVYALVEVQNRHIKRLQSKLPPMADEFQGSPRIG